MDLELKSKAALITGGSRGIGRATAFALAREGARLALVARGAETLAKTAQELRAIGAEVFTFEADLTIEGAAAEVTLRAIAALGGLDILVANAGGSFGARELGGSTGVDWEKTYRFNVLHAIEALQAARPSLARSGQGSAIFIASISGRTPATRGAQYAAAKAALIQAAKSLAWELGPERIRVNTLSPGSILFPGGGWERTRAERPEDFATFEALDFPWGRLGSAEEVADAVAFLASPRSRWINATDIHVDGGQRRPSIR